MKSTALSCLLWLCALALGAQGNSFRPFVEKRVVTDPMPIKYCHKPDKSDLRECDPNRPDQFDELKALGVFTQAAVFANFRGKTTTSYEGQPVLGTIDQSKARTIIEAWLRNNGINPSAYKLDGFSYDGKTSTFSFSSGTRINIPAEHRETLESPPQYDKKTIKGISLAKRIGDDVTFSTKTQKPSFSTRILTRKSNGNFNLERRDKDSVSYIETSSQDNFVWNYLSGIFGLKAGRKSQGVYRVNKYSWEAKKITENTIRSKLNSHLANADKPLKNFSVSVNEKAAGTDVIITVQFARQQKSTPNYSSSEIRIDANKDSGELYYEYNGKSVKLPDESYDKKGVYRYAVDVRDQQ